MTYLAIVLDKNTMKGYFESQMVRTFNSINSF